MASSEVRLTKKQAMQSRRDACKEIPCYIVQSKKPQPCTFCPWENREYAPAVESGKTATIYSAAELPNG